MKFNTIAALILIIWFLIIIVQNAGIISLRFLVWKISMSGIIFMPLILIIGFILGFIVAKVKRKK